MKCESVRIEIERQPLDEMPPCLWRAVEDHTRDCPECAADLAQEKRLEASLRSLPDTSVGVDLAPAVLARLARRATDAALAGEIPAPAGTLPRLHGRLAWAAMIVGATLALGGRLWGLLVGEVPLDAVLRWTGEVVSIPLPVPVATPAAIAVAVGVVLVVSGLAAPIRD